MKTRTFTKNLIVHTPPTKESLKKAFTAYKPKSFKDFIVICMVNATAVDAAKKGWLDRPGTYEISDIWFSKETSWNKVICRVRKIS